METESLTYNPPVELLESKLYSLGGMVELDGRVSWVRAEATGYQPVNCYLLVEGERALLIDSGLPVHLSQITGQLRELLTDEQAFSLYVTRMELDCVGNVSALTQTFRTDAVLTGGTYNPFDGFDQITADTRGEHGEPVVRILPGEFLELFPDRRVEVLKPPLRMLTSYWAYDIATRTLFTSDVFGYGAAETPAYQAILRAPDDASTVASVASALEAKYWWVPVVDRTSLIEGLDAIFADREIDRIAPTHGFVLEGPELVRKHYRLLRDVLSAGTEASARG